METFEVFVAPSRGLNRAQSRDKHIEGGELEMSEVS